MKQSRSDSTFAVFNNLFMLFLNVVMLYPIVYTFSVSISDATAVSYGKVWLLPIGFSLEAYAEVVSDSLFLGSYANTFFYSVSCTLASLTLLTLTAYPLSIPGLRWKHGITTFFAFTMFFSGGMIPTYLVVRSIGILNTVWAVILPGALGVWNIVLCRTFFQNIPTSLRESAAIDGAGEIRILTRIVLPLSKPLMVVMALYVVVGTWNNYFTPFIYLNNQKLFPLQVVLRRLLTSGKTAQTGNIIDPSDMMTTIPATIRSASIMLTILPIIFTYPFIQKHFVKGVMVGSIKG